MSDPQGKIGEELDKLEVLAKEVSQIMRDKSNFGNATITVSAGGIGVWIAVTSAFLCAILFIVMLLGGGYLYLNMKDHLDAIYMMAPSLQKEVKHVEQPKPVHSPDR